MLPPALALAALAAWAATSDVPGWERSVTREVASWPDAAGVLLRPAVELGNRLVAIVVAVLVGVRWGWQRGIVVAGGALGASVVATVLKETVGRPRITPDELGADPRQLVEGFSFPSSHAAVAFGLMVGVALAGRATPRWAALAVLAASATAVGRLWLGVHYPLDVAGGALAGTVCAVAAALLVTHRSSRGPTPP